MSPLWYLKEVLLGWWKFFWEFERKWAGKATEDMVEILKSEKRHLLKMGSSVPDLPRGHWNTVLDLSILNCKADNLEMHLINNFIYTKKIEKGVILQEWFLVVSYSKMSIDWFKMLLQQSCGVYYFLFLPFLRLKHSNYLSQFEHYV